MRKPKVLTRCPLCGAMVPKLFYVKEFKGADKAGTVVMPAACQACHDTRLFNARLCALMESAFPWLRDGEEEANGGDAVDAVSELYANIGGVQASDDEAEPATR